MFVLFALSATALEVYEEMPLATASTAIPPPVQTEQQRLVWSAKAAAAQESSDAATPIVLTFFQSAEFRELLQQCCPEAASISAEELLERYRAELRSSEISHMFPAAPSISGRMRDFTIAAGFAVPWFMNEWQATLASGSPAVGHPQDVAEQVLFNCTPFAAKQPTWDEAADRIIYTALNFLQLDTGSTPNYGDVTAVFSTATVRNMVLLSAGDTGAWELNCHAPTLGDVTSSAAEQTLSLGLGIMPGFNCSAWKPPIIGTLDHLDHLILPNFAMLPSTGVTLAQRAARLLNHTAFAAGPYAGLPPIERADAVHYMEADLMGNPRLEGGVSFVIGAFAELFGTPLGSELQRLACRHAWPLFWALGDGGDKHALVYRGNQRLLDPLVTRAIDRLNVTLPTGASRDFNRVWSEVEHARGRASVPVQQYVRWWAELAAEQIRVAPITATSCAVDVECIATQVSNGQCVCFTTPAYGRGRAAGEGGAPSRRSPASNESH